ncbi:swi5-dependent recombination DNA repair protein 1 homolog isoform 2-T2 [Thomomys bottae]
MESPSASAVILPSTPQSCGIPPSPHTNSLGKQPMSATLRERLRKSRSSFSSYCSVVKRLKVENEENDEAVLERQVSSTGQNSFKPIDNESEENMFSYECDSKAFGTGSCTALQDDFVNENPKRGLKEEKAQLVKQIQEKEELLRRLKLVKMYRSKNDLSQLQLLIKKWRNSSQLLLYELQSAMSEENKKLSLTQLIDHYGLDDKLLHYNRSEEEFLDD